MVIHYFLVSFAVRIDQLFQGTGAFLSVFDVQLRIFASGAAGFYKDWIHGGYTITAKEAARAMAEILPPCLKGNIFQRQCEEGE